MASKPSPAARPSPQVDLEDDDEGPLSWEHPVDSLVLVLTSHEYFGLVATLLLVGEALLCLAIIQFVPYTEIDWSTYMQQISIYLGGERDYGLLKGDTGPIVYPAGFVYVYSVLYWMTDKGRDIRIAQYVFAELYVITLAMVFAIYHRCATVPPYALILVTLSKRLHSIYVLRLFNDGMAMLFFYAAVLAWTNKRPFITAGSILFSLALSIKMNLLLYAPALLYIFFTTLGLVSSLIQIALIVLVQIALAAPFLTNPSNALIYLHTAFNFSREFSWEWTVNWRWLGEEAFSSPELSKGLLALNTFVLVLFGFKWAEKEGGVFRVIWRGLKRPTRGAALSIPSADHVVTILFSSNLVGIVFARSLHYQFYAWYAHQIVFLAWHTPFDHIQKLAILGAIEYGWNKFPSTLNSSMGLTFANAFILAGVYYGTKAEMLSASKSSAGREKTE